MLFTSGPVALAVALSARVGQAWAAMEQAQSVSWPDGVKGDLNQG